MPPHCAPLAYGTLLRWTPIVLFDGDCSTQAGRLHGSASDVDTVLHLAIAISIKTPKRCEKVLARARYLGVN